MLTLQSTGLGVGFFTDIFHFILLQVAMDLPEGDHFITRFCGYCHVQIGTKEPPTKQEAIAQSHILLQKHKRGN